MQSHLVRTPALAPGSSPVSRLSADPPAAIGVDPVRLAGGFATDSARRQADAWRRLSVPADPMAAPRVNAPMVPAALVQQARELEGDIVRRGGHTSDRIGLQVMLGAVAAQQARYPGSITSNDVYFVDMGLDNQAPRGYILDLVGRRVVRGPFRVAAGHDSGPMNGVPTNFTPGSDRNTTELGLAIAYKIGPGLRIVGGREIRSEGIYLRGVGTENGGVDDGHKYVHAADEYISATHTGRSDGCPATRGDDYLAIRTLVGVGGAVFIYAPSGNWRLMRITGVQDNGRY